jgi:hypothetical protein
MADYKTPETILTNRKATRANQTTQTHGSTQQWQIAVWYDTPQIVVSANRVVDVSNGSTLTHDHFKRTYEIEDVLKILTRQQATALAKADIQLFQSASSLKQATLEILTKLTLQSL